MFKFSLNMQNKKSSNLNNIYTIKSIFFVIIIKYNNFLSKIKSLFSLNYLNIIVFKYLPPTHAILTIEAPKKTLLDTLPADATLAPSNINKDLPADATAAPPAGTPQELQTREH